MGDSVRVVDNHYVHRIHSGKTLGKLHKGHSITAASASIPSKYQTLVTDNADKKGFNAKAKRFNVETTSNENPGPGSYVGHITIEKNSTSFSKKGTGGFASKEKRITRNHMPSGPGAGTYALPSMLNSRRDYNRSATTSVFHSPIAQARSELGRTGPGPNQYDLTKSAKLTNKTNNVGADAAFKSQSKRDWTGLGDTSNKPAPWQYHIKDELTRNSVKVPISSFKSETKRKMAPDPEPVPGPGAYRPFEEMEAVPKTVFPRKHYLCISAPAMPLPDTPPAPGPGAYEMVDYEGPDRHFMSSSQFVSTTSRWTGNGKTAAFPGPAHYRPLENGKQSFIYNSAGKWI